MTEQKRVIGIDFDNTLADYDDILHGEAVRRGWVDAGTPKTKKSVRDAVRLLDDGEVRWQKLQASVYGPLMQGARLMEGAKDFLLLCRSCGVPVRIVSHKARRYKYDDTGTDFRRCALAWMEKHGFFQEEGLGLDRESVNFEETREGKVRRIGALGCTHFIDDLEETFLEEGFPQGVEKILYDRHGEGAVTPEIRRAPTWGEISGTFFPSSVLERLLARDIDSLEPIGGGRNSRVYRVECGENVRYAAKFYHRDERGRLGAEYGGLCFLWNAGIRRIPKPIAFDAAAGCAVYEYLEGESIVPASVTVEDIDAAVAFTSELRARTSRADARALPLASEACLSLKGLVSHLHERRARLDSVEHAGLREFLLNSFDPLLARIEAGFAASDAELPEGLRTLSPSDFGFHNALRGPDGRIKFLDFEYFGWDDPAKLVSDFLLHPAMGLRRELGRRFVTGVLEVFSDQPELRARIEAVYPLYGLKWCLILLNEFVLRDRERRDFSGAAVVSQRQLEKALTMAARIKAEYEVFPYYE